MVACATRVGERQSRGVPEVADSAEYQEDFQVEGLEHGVVAERVGERQSRGVPEVPVAEEFQVEGLEHGVVAERVGIRGVGVSPGLEQELRGRISRRTTVRRNPDQTLQRLGARGDGR